LNQQSKEKKVEVYITAEIFPTKVQKKRLLCSPQTILMENDLKKIKNLH